MCEGRQDVSVDASSLKSFTRRMLFAALPACLAAQAPTTEEIDEAAADGWRIFPFYRPHSETFVVRLTSLQSASYLPAAANRFVSLKDRTLIFSSDRNGSLAPFQVDLRSGAVRQLAAPAQLITQSLCLDPKERWLYFLDGEQLMWAEMAKKTSAGKPASLWRMRSPASVWRPAERCLWCGAGVCSDWGTTGHWRAK